MSSEVNTVQTEEKRGSQLGPHRHVSSEERMNTALISRI